MEETSDTINGNLNLRPDISMIKSLLEEIHKNTKELETFLNLNMKIRSSLYELVQSFLSCNDESKILSK
jgi:hypothetical protein